MNRKELAQHPKRIGLDAILSLPLSWGDKQKKIKALGIIASLHVLKEYSKDLLGEGDGGDFLPPPAGDGEGDGDGCDSEGDGGECDFLPPFADASEVESLVKNILGSRMNVPETDKILTNLYAMQLLIFQNALNHYLQFGGRYPTELLKNLQAIKTLQKF